MSEVGDAQGEIFLILRFKDFCCLQVLNCGQHCSQNVRVRVKAWVQMCGSNQGLAVNPGSSPDI